MAHLERHHAKQDLLGRRKLLGEVLDVNVIEFQSVLPAFDLADRTLFVLLEAHADGWEV